jgi:hypothetical protein
MLIVDGGNVMLFCHVCYSEEVEKVKEKTRSTVSPGSSLWGSLPLMLSLEFDRGEILPWLGLRTTLRFTIPWRGHAKVINSVR